MTYTRPKTIHYRVIILLVNGSKISFFSTNDENDFEATTIPFYKKLCGGENEMFYYTKKLFFGLFTKLIIISTDKIVSIEVTRFT